MENNEKLNSKIRNKMFYKIEKCRLDLKCNKLKNTLAIIKESSKLSKESKKMINDLIRFIVLYINKDVDD